MRISNIIIQLFFLSFLIASCTSQDGKVPDGLKPQARGADGEIVLVIDSTTYAGVVGDEIKSTFQSQVAFLSRSEPYFTVRIVRPEDVNSVLRKTKNLIYVTILGDDRRSNRLLKRNFTKESMAQIRENPSLYKFTKEDEFAIGQEVLHLFAMDEETLARHIAENKESLRDYFNDIENKRTYKKLFSAKSEKGLSNYVKNNYQCEIKLPAGYELAIDNKTTMWARILDPFADRNILISYTQYTSQDQFKKENVIQLRDSVLKKSIFGDPDNSNSFMVTEKEHFPVFYKEVNFNGKYAVQLRGMWKTNNLSMGGAFVGYVVVDETLNRLYYIEGFLYSPGRKQREYLRELDVILQTFMTTEKPS